MFGRLSPRARRNVTRILPFGIIWFFFSVIFLISDWAAVGDQGNIPDAAIRLDAGIFFFASLAVAVVGMLVGTIELLYMHNRFVDRSLTRKIVYKVFFYSLLLFMVTVVTFPIAASMELDTSLWDLRVWDKLATFLVSKTHANTAIQLFTMLGVSLFYAEISEHMGHGVLVNFFTGRYHTPKQESRIFMFSDMKSSTAIAERLGHVRYFELLQAYYIDLSDAIVDHAGEIYQYVGDEVVVSWPLEDGLHEDNCIACFHAMKRDLARRTDWYEREFGTRPDFKAGYHVGPVTTGEIGALKKEIIFTGDVLNATARIQSLCNACGVDVLISGELASRLQPETAARLTSLGRQTLRGRERNIELFTISEETPRPPA